MSIQDEPDTGCRDCRSLKNHINELERALRFNCSFIEGQDKTIKELEAALREYEDECDHLTPKDCEYNCNSCKTYQQQIDRLYSSLAMKQRELDVADSNINELNKQVITRDAVIKDLKDELAAVDENDEEYVRELEHKNQALESANNKLIKRVRQVRVLLDEEYHE